MDCPSQPFFPTNCIRTEALVCIALHMYRKQSTLVISTSLISNKRLYRREILVPVFHGNLRTGNKILWKRGEIAPKEQFLLFSTLLYIYFRSQITYSFVKYGCSIYCFPHFRNTDMSRYGYLEVFQIVSWNSRKRESTVCSKYWDLAQRAHNVEPTSIQHVESTLFQRCVPTG